MQAENQETKTCPRRNFIIEIDSGVIKKFHCKATDSENAGNSILMDPVGNNRVRKTETNTELRRNPMRLGCKKWPWNECIALASNNRKKSSDLEPRKRIKLSQINTRSRKCLEIGSTYEAPMDQCEWKIWPAHGMHERPVYHQRVGVATEYLNRTFFTMNDSIYELLDEFSGKKSPEGKFLIFTNSKKVNSLKTCMHDDFHSVLAFCAQSLNPSNENVMNKVNVDLKQEFLKKSENIRSLRSLLKNQKLLVEKPSFSSPKNWVLFENSEGNLTRTFSSRKNYEDSSMLTANQVHIRPPKKIPQNLKKDEVSCLNRTSEIAKILAEYNQDLKIKTQVKSGTEIFRNSMRSFFKKRETDGVLDLSMSNMKNENVETKVSENLKDTKWLSELLEDTAILYCAANGVSQDDLANYIDTLDTEQSLEWLKEKSNIVL